MLKPLFASCSFVIFSLALLSAFCFHGDYVSATEKYQVLIIHDERPQMQVLASYLRETGHLNVKIVQKDSLVQDLKSYRAVIVFIHKELPEKVEIPLIDYTKNGGRLIALHHTISSAKRKNKFFLDFLGIELPQAKVEDGGYGYREGVTLELINLNPHHFITSHDITWPQKTSYQSSDSPNVEKLYPCIKLFDTEGYINHTFTDGREKTVLCGIKFQDPKNKEWYMQDRGAWYKPHGKGTIFYFMPGHRVSDYENKSVAQMILNAILVGKV